MTHLPAYQPHRSAAQADLALKQSIAIQDQAQHCALLWFGEIMRRRLYRDLNFSTMRAYAIEGLGFSETRAGDFIRLATRLEELPVLKEGVASGQIGYTKVREIVPVADRDNEQQWADLAKEKSRRELAVEVRRAKQEAAQKKKHNPDQGELMPRPASPAPAAALSVRVGFELTALQNARYEALLAKIGHSGAKADLLLDMAEALLVAESAPRGVDSNPHYQIHVHECPSCEKSTIQTPQGEVSLTAKQAETAHCDAQVHQTGQPNKSAIRPSVRKEVLTRDRHQCRRKGCTHTRFLEIHHVIPRQKNGTNAPENLVTLCTACHDLWHENGGDLKSLLTPTEGAECEPR
ncbi:MAG: HNH endonuclease [Candidatus Krumholzibacteria bacterium]|nr:HNH endonuclease [Candidatus Krumholzibacteria bacterium]